MIKLIKTFQYDKKRTKQFYTVMGYHNNVRFVGCIVSNTKENTININWLIVHTTTPEETAEAKKVGLKADQSILELLSESDKQILIDSVQQLIK